MGNNRAQFFQSTIYSCALTTGRCEEVVRCIVFTHNFNLLFFFIFNIKSKNFERVENMPESKKVRLLHL